MANERALGLSFMYAAQTWRQMVVCCGEGEARSLFGLTNNIVIFGGGKDIHFYREVSDLLGTTRVARQSYSDGPGGWAPTGPSMTSRCCTQSRSGSSPNVRPSSSPTTSHPWAAST